MSNWSTISSLATAGGTLILAGATFTSVRSANRAARVAEESLLTGIRPLIMPSRPDDPPLKVGFADEHFVHTPGGSGTAEATDQVIYLTMSIRNVGNGIAVLIGWRVELGDPTGQTGQPDVDSFRRLTRDLYVASGDVAFWQGAIRDPADEQFAPLTAIIAGAERMVIDLLYSDHLGGQRVISRFVLNSRGEGAWLASPARHWNVDRPNPR
ncbi:MAG TPA: hypothetical protein VND83_02800 [Acidimicrobiales bacterium]|nr:hypothetical protein [Acidimicrobiales bacterium]